MASPNSSLTQTTFLLQGFWDRVELGLNIRFVIIFPKVLRLYAHVLKCLSVVERQIFQRGVINIYIYIILDTRHCVHVLKYIIFLLLFVAFEFNRNDEHPELVKVIKIPPEHEPRCMMKSSVVQKEGVVNLIISSNNV